MPPERSTKMENKKFRLYYLFSCIGILIASYYPISMGVRVIHDMIADGVVSKENYPKYIIPYTPICFALIIGVLLLPLCMKLFRKYATAVSALAATGIFFIVEFLLENKVVVTTAKAVALLKDWQMYMCAFTSRDYLVQNMLTQTPIEILMGEYSPAFKLHFYIISVVLIVTVLNCLYGFAQMIRTGEKKRLRTLILQSVCSVTFLGLCILACFTSFWRDGNLRVSPLSSALMTIFFVLLGVTVGVYIGSFLLEKAKPVSILIPSIVASVMTFLMYIGEMILLNGHLYVFGEGFLYDSIPRIVFAPFDLLVILISGGITALLFALLSSSPKSSEKGDPTKPL